MLHIHVGAWSRLSVHTREGIIVSTCTCTCWLMCAYTHLQDHKYVCLCTWAWLCMHGLTAITVSIRLVQAQNTCMHCLTAITESIRLVHAGLVVHVPLGCVAKINIPWPWPWPWCTYTHNIHTCIAWQQSQWAYAGPCSPSKHTQSKHTHAWHCSNHSEDVPWTSPDTHSSMHLLACLNESLGVCASRSRGHGHGVFILATPDTRTHTCMTFALTLCSRSRSRSRYIYFSNASWRDMVNQSQPSFTQHPSADPTKALVSKARLRKQKHSQRMRPGLVK